MSKGWEKNRFVSLRMSESLYGDLYRYAKRLNMSVSEVIHTAVRKYVPVSVDLSAFPQTTTAGGSANIHIFNQSAYGGPSTTFTGRLP